MTGQRPAPHPRRAAAICGIGSSLPPRVISNEELTRQGSLQTSDAWIRSRTGIVNRRRAAPGTATGDLATGAGRAALESAGGPPPDLLLLATTTPDRHCPATAPEVAHRLGLSTIPAFDLAAVCSGFVYGMSLATALLLSGDCARPLVIAAETYSSIIDPLDRDTAYIFGDGAGAVVLRGAHPGQPGAVIATDLGSDGSRCDLIAINGGGSRMPLAAQQLTRHDRYFRMRGRDVYAQAVRRMTESSRAALHRAGWTPGTVAAFIGHQANQRILDSVADRLDIAPRHRFGNIQDVANTAAASIPLALADTAAQGLVPPGARTLLTAFGGGLTWGSIALTWPSATPRHHPPHPRPASEPSPAPPHRRTQPWTMSSSTS
ncbi:beta-ketoacyl-ACP synthase III [Streptomyces sp. CT34]|uniref:beta-ketoacyl-ACP synthase III n=1 Tax=Streptomyces sp. CT34 TaxID=1553907 RepID=UPI00068F6E66|nr:beta-ketoacyl-ACP synthase III [Streptomyces sp. CT34]